MTVIVTAQVFPQSCNITSIGLFQNRSCWGFTDFLIPIPSQTIIAPTLIRFLKSLVSFKATLDIVLVTSAVSCFSQSIFANRSDGTGSFWGFFSNSFSLFVISLALSLTPVTSKQSLAPAGNS